MARGTGSLKKPANQMRKSASDASTSVDLGAIAEAVAADPHPPVDVEAVVAAVEGDAQAGETTDPVPAEGEVQADAAPVPTDDFSVSDTLTHQTHEDSMTDQTTEQMTDAAGAATADMQARFQAAFDKSATMMGDMAELTKGHVEALTESSRIMASGLQDLGREAVANTQSAYATMTEDLRKFAAAKTPAELLQLQSELVRRNMDAAFSQGSRNTEAFLKLANDAFAPMSSRMSVVMDKVAKAA